MNGHTPGPWEYDEQSERITAAEYDIAELWPGPPECAANARLIAAAPELLEALKGAVRIAEEARQQWDAAPNGMKAGKLLIALGGHCPGYRTDIDAIHAAIAKAEGKME